MLDYGSLGGLGSAGFTLGSLPSPQMSAIAVEQYDHEQSGARCHGDRFVEMDRSRQAAHGTSIRPRTGNSSRANSATTYQQSDNVQFDDTGANTAISLPARSRPAMSNSAITTKPTRSAGRARSAGPTALVLTGSGLVTLNTNNDYTGGTYVNGGTLQLGSGGATGSIAGNVVNNALLVFNRSDSASYAGVISGSGAVAQVGSGVLTLLGNNTYGGLTTVSAGSLQYRQRRIERGPWREVFSITPL